MKKILSVLIATMLALSLSACASKTTSDKDMKVKCPACGYEFDVKYENP